MIVIAPNRSSNQPAAWKKRARLLAVKSGRSIACAMIRVGSYVLTAPYAKVLIGGGGALIEPCRLEATFDLGRDL
jgi:hypothetical protein